MLWLAQQRSLHHPPCESPERRIQIVSAKSRWGYAQRNGLPHRKRHQLKNDGQRWRLRHDPRMRELAALDASIAGCVGRPLDTPAVTESRQSDVGTGVSGPFSAAEWGLPGAR
jgi:hypothetical protein